MRVVVGSQNPVKVEASRQAFSLFFEDVQIVPVSVESKVKAFPTSQAETMKGALNRARAAAAAVPTAEFAVGVEAGIIPVQQRKFVQAYAIVLQGKQLGVGASAALELPPNALSLIDPTSDASKDVIDTIFGRKNLFENEGAFGALTNGRLTRTAIIRDAVVCALPRFINPKYYEASPAQPQMSRRSTKKH
jgi:inosine/xanthosine triphosphatase